jgi:hypothetical protein
MTPSNTIVAAAMAASTITDATGRRLSLRRMTSLDKLRLFKAAGPSLAQNQPWLGMAMLAYCVVAIDDVPVPSPTNEQQIEAMVSRLGDIGIAAVADAFDAGSEPDQSEIVASAGN